VSPRQNRVDPCANLIAIPDRGGLTGNRGSLHDAEGRIRRTHRGKRWIFCLLEFKGRRRELMQPGRYTELFFLDEATAFAAGHRPCMECMRARAVEFRDVWIGANPDLAAGSGRVTAIDEVLHRERIDPAGGKVTFESALGELPDGAMVLAPSPAGDSEPLLLRSGELRRWSFGGYGPGRPADPDATVEVLTPRSVVNAFAAGFEPLVSARGDAAA
jgi:hypothetical protein